MTIERRITAALQYETANVRLPEDLSERIMRAAAQPARQPWLAWTRRRAVQVAAAALLVLPLAGFASKQIWVERAQPPGTAQTAQRPYNEMAVAELAKAVDFKLKLPAYLPEGMHVFGSGLAGDSTKADARLRVAGVYWQQDGVGGLGVEQWRGEKAAAFPPGHPFPAVLDTKPWHKTLMSSAVKVGDRDAAMFSYLISGMPFNRVYWHENGIDYAVDATANLPVAELLKVAASLQ